MYHQHPGTVLSVEKIWISMVTRHIIAQNAGNMLVRNKTQAVEKAVRLTAAETGVYEDPFSYFADVIRKKISVPEFSVYSIANNMMVVRILEAAKKSAGTGTAVMIKKSE